MSIDLDSFPLPLYAKDREGPEPNRERKLNSTHSRMARPVHRAVGLPSKHLPTAPAACQAGSALVILTVLSAGPFPIALTISYARTHSGPPSEA